MANSQFTFTDSKPDEAFENSFLCNSLEEKTKFIYYRRGSDGEPQPSCGTDKYKLRKSKIRSWELTGDTCSNGSPVWRVTII